MSRPMPSMEADFRKAEGREEAVMYVLPTSGGPAQKIHASAMLLLPSAAMAWAGWRALTGDADLVDWSLAVSLYVATMLGITVGFHRLFAHRAFRAHWLLKVVLLALGSMAAQGPPIYWVANHRRHHRFSDDAGDPHSPIDESVPGKVSWRSFWHAHSGWMFGHKLSNTAALTKDLIRDPMVVAVNRSYYAWVILGLAIPAVLGSLLIGGAGGALEGLAWGGGVRLFISYHLTSCINSVTHSFGYRTYATPDFSRNNAWIGAATLGEAWHNNHHACASSAKFGHSWWELDPGWIFIRLMEAIGAARDVQRPSARVIDRTGRTEKTRGTGT